MRKAAALLLLLTLLLSACSRAKSPPPPPVTEAPPPVVEGPAPKPLPEGPDLMAVASPYELSLPELAQGLRRYLAQGEGSVADRLNRLYDHWKLKPLDDHIRLAEADLDGDGVAEVVTALNGAGGITGSGALFVIYQRDGQAVIDRSAEEMPGVRLFAVADLAPQTGPEILWSSTQTGAHTAHTRAIISHWEPGRLTALPGGVMQISFARLQLEGADLLLTGGMVGSAGAGGAQRARTDRYRWVEEEFRLVDRRFAESNFAYHRLIDGIAAESFGRPDDADAAYRQAMAEGRPVLLTGGVPPEQEAFFAQAVRNFARFRLGLLLWKAGGSAAGREILAEASGPFAGLAAALAQADSWEAGCKAAQAWGEQNPAFFEALNSPYGYANPIFQPEDLCGPLPPMMG